MKRLKSNAQPLNGINNNIFDSRAATFALSGWTQGGGECLVQGSNTKLLYDVTVKPKPSSKLRTLERYKKYLLCSTCIIVKLIFSFLKCQLSFPAEHIAMLSLVKIPYLLAHSYFLIFSLSKFFFLYIFNSSSIGGMSGSPMICTSLIYLGLPDSAFPSALSREGKEQRR